MQALEILPMPNFQKDGCGTKHQRNGHHVKEEPRSVVFTMHIQLLEKDIICGCC